MGTFKQITNPETIKKIELAKKYKSQGLKNKDIAKKMGLSESRISELLRGVNWISKASQ